MSSAPDTPAVRPLAPLLLLALSLGESLLSLYQWMQLLVVRAGGHSLCSLNEVINCEAVWNSGFASRVHHLIQMPLAALGLVWGLGAFGVSAALVHRLLSGGKPEGAIAGARLLAAVGLLSCVTFGVASFRMGALCLTCLGTYLLVIAFALVAARALPGALVPQGPALKAGLGWAGGLTAGAYLVLLGPGMMTPSSEGPSLAKELEREQSPTHPTPNAPQAQALLERFLTSLPYAQQQEVSQSLSVYRHSPAPTQFPSRFLEGQADAPVHIVEFTDVRCPHCKHLEQTLKELRAALPPGTFSVEPRAFPLDGECNQVIPGTDGSHVRCTGAKALICLEGRKEYWDVREKMFAEQDTLSADRILELASGGGGLSKEALTRCIESDETKGKLDQDIAFAMQYQPEGTPLVLINGREGTASPAFLYAMLLTGGNADAPAFARLAPPALPVQP